MSLRSRVDVFLDRKLSLPALNYRQAMAILLPALVDAVLLKVLGIINMSMISLSGGTAVNAVSIVDTLTAVMYCGFTGLSVGGSVVAATYFGKADKEKLHHAAMSVISVLSCIYAATLTIMVVFRKPILALLLGDAPVEMVTAAEQYLLSCAIMVLLGGVMDPIMAVLRGMGHTKKTMTISLLRSGMGALFNVIFLGVFNLGIPGIMLSTTLCYAASIPIAFRLKNKVGDVLRYDHRLMLHPDKAAVKRMVFLGVPYTLETALFQGGMLVFARILLLLDAGRTAEQLAEYSAVTAYSIAFSFAAYSQAIGATIQTSLQTFVGIVIGRGGAGQLRSLLKKYVKLNMCCYVGFGLVMLAAFPLILATYRTSDAIAAEAFRMVLIVLVTETIFHSAGFLFPEGMRAAGDGVFATCFSMGVMWFVRVAGAYLFAIVLDWGVLGVWMAMMLDWVVRAVVNTLRLRGDRWLRHLP